MRHAPRAARSWRRPGLKCCSPSSRLWKRYLMRSGRTSVVSFWRAPTFCKPFAEDFTEKFCSLLSNSPNLPPEAEFYGRLDFWRSLGVHPPPPQAVRTRSLVPGCQGVRWPLGALAPVRHRDGIVRHRDDVVTTSYNIGTTSSQLPNVVTLSSRCRTTS